MVPRSTTSGAVTLIRRFGSAANIHLHSLVLDGVYCCGADGAPTFAEEGAPTDDELHALLQTVITRPMECSRDRGVLGEDMGHSYLADPDDDGTEARMLRPLQAAAITYRIAFGLRAASRPWGSTPSDPRATPSLNWGLAEGG